METLPPVQQNILAPTATAGAAGNATVDGAAAADTSLPPQGFGALLALQLGGTAITAKADLIGAAETPADGTAAPGDAASTALPAMAADALTALNLPALLPATTPAAPTPVPRATHGNSPVLRAAEGSELAPLAGATQPASPKDAAVQPSGPPRSGETAAPRSTEDLLRARDTAAAQLPALHGAPAELHAAETPAPGAMPPAIAQAAAAATAPATASSVQAALATRVGTPEWNTELGQKIVWMVGDRRQVAEMHVNPPELGPLDIKITIDGSQTNAVFTSPHSAVREAVESALPRLREVLADSGLMLGNASVTSDTPRDSQDFAEQRPGTRAGSRLAADSGAVAAPQQIIRNARGLVDLFA